ncbi:DNA cytosine methyltransferase [Roseinatronobacter sp.]|uniref:DNA cytosine methyltransferase n=1 Tax=Roseinatronobacter sp. TaxID=1945755 RepID=UPI003F716761
MQRPMIIDSFAGGGGASTGIEAALGYSPDVAINHNPAALALHAANHPDALHIDSNIWDVEPRWVTQGRKVGLLWASPDCKHFSKAKGGAPRDRNIRDLAWVVVKWAEDTRPDVICMENVEEFVTWGPIGEDGQPIKELAGVTFDLWIKRLKKAGYRVQWRELRACDYGAPTIRKRWFLVARCDGRPIRWPKPTHGDPKSPEVRKGRLKPWRTAAECIDWSLSCPSIFDSAAQIKARYGLRAVRPLAANTLARVARGMKRYVLDAQRPFIVNLTHGARLEGADDPFRTITGAHRGEKAVVVPSIIGCGGRAAQSRPRGGDEPFATITAKADACLSSAFLATMRNSQKPWQGADEPAHTITAGGAGLTLIAPSLTRFNSGATGSDLRSPAPTVTANSWIKKPGGAAPLGILAPYLASIAHGDSGGRREYPMGDPLGTVTMGGIQHAVIQPHLLSMKGTARRNCDALAPHPTVLAGGGHSALIAPVLTYAQQGGSNRPADALHHTICASRKDQNSIFAASLVQTGYGERDGQLPRALDINDPLGTVVAGGVKHAPFAAFLAQQNGGPHMDGHNGRDPLDPLSTVTAAGSQQTPVSAFFAKYYGTGDGTRHDEPAHTVTVRDRFAHTEAQLAAPPFAPEHHDRAREVAEFLRSQGVWDGGEFVTLTIDRAEFVVVDIGLRMLTPRELFNAQGFPPDYVIEGVWIDQPRGEVKWHPFSKDVQVSCCGNSVCPPLAEAIVAANCAHLKADALTKEAQL